MATARLTSKGQITIPAAVRLDLSLTEGNRVEFIIQEDGSYRIAAKNQSVMALHGMVQTDISLSDEELKEHAAAGFAREDNNDQDENRLAI